jgi:alkylation response protein AidB-like acyl-CoA dehydrogenase
VVVVDGRQTAFMNFAFTEEQEELRKTVRQFLDAKSPETAVREQMETDNGFDPAVWSQAGEQLGLQGLIIPEEFGGSGYSYVELGIVLEEMGRALLCAPFFSTVVLAANTLIHSGDDAAKAAHLPGIAAGTTIATLAFTEPSGKWDESGITTQATGSGDSFTLNGTKMFVLDGHTADLIIVAARTDKGVSLFTVDGGAAGLTRTALSTMDQTRKQAKLEFANTPATLLGTEGEGWNVLGKVLDLAAVALAAEQVGGAQRCLDMAVAYAKERQQFGRPIGSFQAIKHKAADMFVAVESARSALYYAACIVDDQSDDLATNASLAKAWCSEAYFKCAADNIQIHGGVGFTWEYDPHLHFKRARASESWLGTPADHRERVAKALGL